MKILLNQDQKQKYIERYEINKILTMDIIDVIELVEYRSEETIIEEAETLNYYYFFVEGRLKIFQRQENGRNLLLQFYNTFETLGDLELMEQMEASCTVVALETSKLLRIDAAVLRHYAMTNPVFLRFIIRSLSSKLEMASRNYSKNLLYPVKNRLAGYLMLHQLQGHTIILKESFQEVSEFIGTTYRQLHRAFLELENDGIIHKDSKRITIKDQKKLQHLAGQIYQIL